MNVNIKSAQHVMDYVIFGIALFMTEYSAWSIFIWHDSRFIGYETMILGIAMIMVFCLYKLKQREIRMTLKRFDNEAQV